jgi:hypothetical protein
VTRLSPYAESGSAIGWIQVVPPVEQLPDPPETRPTARTVVPEPGLVTAGAPDAPGSAHVLARMSWLTQPCG